MKTFAELVDAVEDNNEINGAKWSDWEGAWHIQEVYGELHEEFSDTATAFLCALIRDNGANVQLYLDAMDAIEYGQVFHRGGN